MKEQKPSNDSRKRHNEQLIRRMKSGEPLWSYDSKASWFPPRPIIEKDPEAIKRLYNSGTSDDSQYQDTTVRHIENRLKLLPSLKDQKKTDQTG